MNGRIETLGMPPEMPPSLAAVADAAGAKVLALATHGPRLAYSNHTPRLYERLDGAFAHVVELGYGCTADDATQHMLNDWYSGLGETDGSIRGVSALRREDGSAAEITIVGDRVIGAPKGRHSPAVRLEMYFEGDGRVGELAATVGFAQGPRFLDVHASKCVVWSRQDIDELRSLGYPEMLPEDRAVPAVGAILQKAGRVAEVVQDPLMAEKVYAYQQIIADPARAEALVWQRPGSAQNNDDKTVEMCFVDVDPMRYGTERFLMLMRNPLEPGVVLVYTDGEWDAFKQGAIAGEFD